MKWKSNLYDPSEADLIMALMAVVIILFIVIFTTLVGVYGLRPWEWMF